jgi:N-acyl-D-amino-acid deacylase
LGYPSGRAISKREITAVFKELKKHSAVFSFHLRDESNTFIDALKEVVDIVQQHHANTLISHLKVQGKNNFENFDQAISIINQANQPKDPFIHFDIYPYDYICQSIYNLLPDWLTIGGTSAIKKNLSDPLIVKKLAKDLKENKDIYKNLIIVGIEKRFNIFKNKTIEQVAKNMDTTTENALIKILSLAQKQIIVLNQNLSQKNIDIGIKNQYSIPATNGISFDHNKNNTSFCHQRSIGSFPKYLSTYQKTIPFETLIYKITGLVKEKLNLKTKGIIASNQDADITIINPQTIQDNSTIQNPLAEPKGIETVIINGQIVFNKGFILEKSAGKIIK